MYPLWIRGKACSLLFHPKWEKMFAGETFNTLSFGWWCQGSKSILRIFHKWHPPTIFVGHVKRSQHAKPGAISDHLWSQHLCAWVSDQASPEPKSLTPDSKLYHQWKGVFSTVHQAPKRPLLAYVVGVENVGAEKQRGKQQSLAGPNNLLITLRSFSGLSFSSKTQGGDSK